MNSDFELFLAEIGLTREDLDAVADKIVLAEGDNDTALRCEFLASKIHGTGVFASRRLGRNWELGRGMTYGLWTPIGRYMNHSAESNVKPVQWGMDREHGCFRFLTTREVAQGEELTCNYRDIRAILFKKEAEAMSSVKTDE